MFLLIYTDDKSDQTFFFGLIFPPVDKVIGNTFARDLGGIVQPYMGYRLGNDRSRLYTRWPL